MEEVSIVSETLRTQISRITVNRSAAYQIDKKTVKNIS